MCEKEIQDLLKNYHIVHSSTDEDEIMEAVKGEADYANQEGLDFYFFAVGYLISALAIANKKIASMIELPEERTRRILEEGNTKIWCDYCKEFHVPGIVCGVEDQ